MWWVFPGVLPAIVARLGVARFEPVQRLVFGVFGGGVVPLGAQWLAGFLARPACHKGVFGR